VRRHVDEDDELSFGELLDEDEELVCGEYDIEERYKRNVDLEGSIFVCGVALVGLIVLAVIALVVRKNNNEKE